MRPHDARMYCGTCSWHCEAPQAGLCHVVALAVSLHGLGEVLWGSISWCNVPGGVGDPRAKIVLCGVFMACG